MKKKRKQNKKIKVDLFIAIISIALILLLIVSVIKDNKRFTDDTIEMEIIKSVDAFTKTTVSEALEQINKDELSFIYIGYEGCSACEKFVPRLYDVVEEYGIEVFYINFEGIDLSSKDWKTFTSKFTKEQTIRVEIDEEESSSTKTIGKFLYDDGYTPTYAIFQKGKMIDGNIGGSTRAKLKEVIESAGYEK